MMKRFSRHTNRVAFLSLLVLIWSRGDSQITYAQQPLACGMPAECVRSWSQPDDQWDMTCIDRQVPYDIVARSFRCSDDPRYHRKDFLAGRCGLPKYNEQAWVDAIHTAVADWETGWALSSPDMTFFAEDGANETVKIRGMNKDKYAREEPDHPTSLAFVHTETFSHTMSEGSPCGYNGIPCWYMGITRARMNVNFLHDWVFASCPSPVGWMLRHEIGHVIGFGHTSEGEKNDTVMAGGEWGICKNNVTAQDWTQFLCKYRTWLQDVKPDCGTGGCP